MPEKCITIQRLQSLRPGEIMTVYRGDFDLDLSRENGPKYQKLLHRVHETMRRLEREGRIISRIEQEAFEIPSKGGKPSKIVTFKRYMATGIY